MLVTVLRESVRRDLERIVQSHPWEVLDLNELRPHLSSLGLGPVKVEESRQVSESPSAFDCCEIQGKRPRVALTCDYARRPRGDDFASAARAGHLSSEGGRRHRLALAPVGFDPLRRGA